MSEEHKVHLLPGYFRVGSFQRRNPKRQRLATARYSCSFEKNEDLDLDNTKNTLLKLAIKDQSTSKLKKLVVSKKVLRAAQHEQDLKGSDEARTLSSIKLKKVS